VLEPHLRDTSTYDFVQIEHEAFAPLVPADRSNRWAITLHNLMSTRSRQRAAVSQERRVGWLFERDAARAQRLEQWILDRFDVTIAMSADDAASLGAGVVVVPNGVDLDRFQLTPMPTMPRLIFTASFNWEPNVDAARWFCERVLPQIRQELPEVTLLLVGREPNDSVRALVNLPGVEGHFDVPSVLPFLQSARVAVVPVRMGSGTRLKALEAIAAGRPVAGTTIGLEGLGLVDGASAVIADKPDDLAARIVELCSDDCHARELVDAARSLVEENFSWERIAAMYVDRVLS
jgi:glycosyltransferase involved in cell wall biosynthesis